MLLVYKVVIKDVLDLSAGVYKVPYIFIFFPTKIFYLYFLPQNFLSLPLFPNKYFALILWYCFPFPFFSVIFFPTAMIFPSFPSSQLYILPRHTWIPPPPGGGNKELYTALPSYLSRRFPEVQLPRSGTGWPPAQGWLFVLIAYVIF